MPKPRSRPPSKEKVQVTFGAAVRAQREAKKIGCGVSVVQRVCAEGKV